MRGFALCQGLSFPVPIHVHLPALNDTPYRPDHQNGEKPLLRGGDE